MQKQRRCLIKKDFLLVEQVKQSQPQAQAQFKLKNLEYECQILNNIVNITLNQTFQNSQNKFTDAEYFFPLEDGICLESFEAKYNNKTIKALIAEKQKAEKEYKENKEEGNLVSYASIEHKNKEDQVVIKLGNIPPSESVEIKIKFSQQIQAVLNKYYAFFIPIQHFKEVISAQSDKPLLKLELSCTGKITYVQTKGYPAQKEIINDSTMMFNLNSSALTAKDSNGQMNFQLIYSYEGMFDPQVMLGSSFIHNPNNNSQQNEIKEKRQSVLVSFIPNFNSEISQDIQDQMQAAINDNSELLTDEFQQKINSELTDHLESSKSEFIFLIDRSGSMSGRPIKKAIEALNLFLKSIPVNSYFNVYSFGTTYRPIFQKSIQYNGESLEKALKSVNNFKANLGGTDILKPLKNIFEVQQKIPGYNKQIFLLTDGGVKNPENVIHLIKKNNKSSRIHSIGFGKGADQQLIDRSAIAGKGMSKIIDMSEDLSEIVIEILANCITPSLDDFSISYDTSVVESTYPSTTNFPCVFKDDIINIHFFLKPEIQFENLTENQRLVRIKYYDSQLKQQIQKDIKLEAPDSVVCNSSLQESVFKIGKSIQLNDFFISQEEGGDKDNKFLQQALDHQLLTEKTALICVVEQLNDAQKVQFQIQQLNEFVVDNVRKQKVQISFNKQCRNRLAYQQESSMSVKSSLTQCKKRRCVADPVLESKLKKKKKCILKVKVSSCDDYQEEEDDDDNEMLENDYLDIFEPEEFSNKNTMKRSSTKKEEKNNSKLIEKQENNENILSSNQIFEEIISKVDHLGIWKYNETLIKQYLSNKNEIYQQLQGLSCYFNNQDAFMTIFVLCILELFQTHNKQKWILIFKKSQGFIKKNLKPNQTIDHVKQILKQLIQ